MERFGRPGAAALQHPPSHGPLWSWSTLQPFLHTSDLSGLMDVTTTKIIAANFPMVTIEKWQGVHAKPAGNTTAGGVMLTDSAVERPSTATVIAAGPGKKGEDGVWRRAFASGRAATFDTKRERGTVSWAGRGFAAQFTGP